jgi:thioredoxin-like negative regulator of GroEL
MAITVLKDKASHDVAVSRAEAGTPSLIYVSFEPTPICRTFTPAFKEVADEYGSSSIEFYQLEYDGNTSAMMKFGPQHMPIVTFMEGAKCQMLLQPRIEEVKELIGSFFGKG